MLRSISTSILSRTITTQQAKSVPSSGSVQVQADLTHLAFEVDSLEAFGLHLERLGLKYSDGPTMKPNGGGFAFVDAPEGYEIELIQKADALLSPGSY